MNTRLKEIRLNKGLSQEALAELSKVSLRTIQRIELGQVKPRISTLNLLTNTLDIEDSYLNENLANNTLSKSKEIKILKKMNLALIISLVLPFLNLLVSFVFLYFFPNGEIKSIVKKAISFQILWTLISILLFFLGVFSSNLITGEASNAEYVGFIIYLCCILFNIYVISKNTFLLNKGSINTLNFTPNFF